MDLQRVKIMLNKLKIITRSSKLALWQTHFVEKKLQKAGFETKIVEIETKGDKVLDRSLAKIGSKGLFTEELEEQLRLGKVHLAVHSAKDLPSTLPEGLEIIAFTEREQVNDVLVSFKKNISLNDNIVVGTSSTRRVAILKHHYPHIRTTEMRGNLQTRIQKLENGACDAIILAYAGVHRMGYDDLICQHLPIDIFTPAAGQGSIAIEIAEKLDENTKKKLKETLNHNETATCLKAEREFLHILQGGCSIPIFVLATLENEFLQLKGGIVSLDGSYLLTRTLCVPIAEQENAGKKLAQEILQNGGSQMLKEIKERLGK
ncbi:MAG: hydroxymethylbilane synthase [Raineya sp.]